MPNANDPVSFVCIVLPGTIAAKIPRQLSVCREVYSWEGRCPYNGVVRTNQLGSQHSHSPVDHK